MTPPTQIQIFGRFVWKLLVVVVLTLAAMGVIGLVVRLLFGWDVVDVRS